MSFNVSTVRTESQQCVDAMLLCLRIAVQILITYTNRIDSVRYHHARVADKIVELNCERVSCTLRARARVCVHVYVACAKWRSPHSRDEHTCRDWSNRAGFRERCNTYTYVTSVPSAASDAGQRSQRRRGWKVNFFEARDENAFLTHSGCFFSTARARAKLIASWRAWHFRSGNSRLCERC